ncbi:MAG: leucine-rich repeat domain-containing protein, partial [Dehalococcoidia bacterium]|nr:leucine-rich repeat domain-containing protein [Dehalococcoidia bacterium]
LTHLDLVYNQISDISPLSSLTSLTELYLHHNPISDISPLSSLTNLTHLDLVYNQISDISPLSSLTSLTELYLIGNQISDIEPLVNNPGLSSGDYVYLWGNPLSTTSIDTYIPQLKARGVIVEYRATSLFWLWIVIGFTGTLLVLLVVPLAVIIYIRVKKKKPDYPEFKGKIPISEEKDHDGFLLEQMENTSGQGKLAKIPIEIRGWNWGAFFLNWIWGVGNSVWIALLCLIPFVSFIMRFVLGAKGNEWAWQNRKWDSIEHFKRTQRKWGWWGLGITVGLIVYYSILYTIMFIGL